jgi:hypothetical protein
MILDKKIHFWAFIIAVLFVVNDLVSYYNFPEIINFVSIILLSYNVEIYWKSYRNYKDEKVIKVVSTVFIVSFIYYMILWGANVAVFKLSDVSLSTIFIDFIIFSVFFSCVGYVFFRKLKAPSQ